MCCKVKGKEGRVGESSRRKEIREYVEGEEERIMKVVEVVESRISKCRHRDVGD